MAKLKNLNIELEKVRKEKKEAEQKYEQVFSKKKADYKKLLKQTLFIIIPHQQDQFLKFQRVNAPDFTLDEEK